MSRLMKTEPLWTVAGVTALVVSGIGAASAFGLNLTSVQESAVLAFTALLAPLVVAAVGRSKVWAPESVDMEIEGKTSEALATAAFETGFDDEDDVDSEPDDENDPDLEDAHV